MTTDSDMSNQSSEAQPSPELDALSAGAETEFVVNDEKKPVITQGMLYLLALIMIGGGGTFFMYKRQGPATASAAATPETAHAQKTITTFLATGPGGIKQMQATLQDTEKFVQQFLNYPNIRQVPLSELQKNPFRSTKPNANAKPDNEALQRQREEERADAMNALERLNLQSIVSGKHKACMIDNTLVQEGQQVGRFTVEKINADSVIVKTGVYRFQLKMQH